MRTFGDPVLEKWAVFLHRQVEKLAGASCNGPGRIKRPPGTGKTVIALHRAVTLAQRYAGWSAHEKPYILFTTFVTSLMRGLEFRYNRNPRRVDGAVDFRTVNSVAHKIVREATG